MIKQDSRLFDGAVIAAPMAGITTPAYRNILKNFGASYSVSEMISAQALIYDNKKTWQMLDCVGEQGQLAIQLSGHEPAVMAEAARRICENLDAIGRLPAFLDINMGCPAPKIVRNGDGAALAGDSELAIAVAAAVSRAVPIPVTVKLRLGFDENNENYLYLAKAFEQEGIAAVALHARYRGQFYSGRADREKIALLAQSLSIPVIGNGDIDSIESAADMKQRGCAGIMVGRACIGNPWLMAELRAAAEGEPASARPQPEEIFTLLLSHLKSEIEHACRFEQGKTFAERIAVCAMRAHMGRYFKGLRYAAAMREEINHLQTYNEIEEYLGSMLEQIKNPAEE